MTWPLHRLRTGDAILLVALAAEIALFAVIAPNFATTGNFFEITRLSVELGLLAIALTPVIVTGGIDLSVGAMMGLAAVVFGAACRDWGLHPAVAALIALAVGGAGGALNATLVARLKIPPLIVTLGTFSLFRGIAEGITQAAVNYSGFPPGFLFVGQGYLWGIIPAQLPIFIAVFAAYAVLLHRSVIGRAIYAIGFTPAGARYAGIPVAQRVGLVYVLSGLASSLAAVIYVAHLGQARSTRSRPLCSAGRRCSAAAARSGARSLASSRCRCSATDCASRRFRPNLRACSPGSSSSPRSRLTYIRGAPGAPAARARREVAERERLGVGPQAH
jgi:rhamnose transport system permease protein